MQSHLVCTQLPRRSSRGFIGTYCPIILTALLLTSAGCGSRKSTRGASSGGGQQKAPEGALELIFPYGSEKQKWIEDVTAAFNDEGRKTSQGHAIFVRALPMGSGESTDEILSGRLQAHLVSPASAAFIKMANAESRAKTGKDLVESTENLVLSPVVIAMWKPMAEAIGWGQKPVGWSEILALAKSGKGWQAYNFPQWGKFKFGHTHPLYSNSGLISLMAEAYAAVGKTKDLTVADLKKPQTAAFLSAIESSVVHYGSSTGFFGRKMFANGPQYLSAAVLYESMVVESYGEKSMPFPVVAIYPREGTFWSDHPVGLVEREWVKPEHREAAKAYIQYLLDKPQQEKALTYGFRPSKVEIPIAAPLDAAHGVNPAEPKTTLEVPPVEVISEALKLFDHNKKHSEVVLVLDTSGSMREDQKLENAKLGAKQLLSLLGDDDMFSLLPFNTGLNWAGQDMLMGKQREKTAALVDSLFPEGNTALYDAIGAAYQHLEERRDKSQRIQAVVVLTDGTDTNSRTRLDELLQRIRFTGEEQSIRVFTIAYGQDAQQDVLKSIADATQAKTYAGTPQNIVSVFRDICTFF